MIPAFDILLLFLFVIIIYQDFLHREVSWLLFPAAILVLGWKGIYLLGILLFLKYFGINLLFLILQFAWLFCWFSLRHKKPVNPINDKIGLGDVLLFIILCEGFAPLFFGSFLVTSLLVILVVFVILKMIKHRPGKSTIPLAGGLSLAYTLVIVAGYIFPFINLYDDQMIGGLFYGY
jgi:hypothetical protein